MWNTLWDVYTRGCLVTCETSMDIIFSMPISIIHTARRKRKTHEESENGEKTDKMQYTFVDIKIVKPGSLNSETKKVPDCWYQFFNMQILVQEGKARIHMKTLNIQKTSFSISVPLSTTSESEQAEMHRINMRQHTVCTCILPNKGKCIINKTNIASSRWLINIFVCADVWPPDKQTNHNSAVPPIRKVEHETTAPLYALPRGNVLQNHRGRGI